MKRVPGSALVLLMLTSQIVGQEQEKEKVDDRDPSGALMRPYRNYRFHAWRHTSNIHRERGDAFRALDAHFRSRAAYVSHCATCMSGMAGGFVRALKSQGLDLLHGKKRKSVDKKKLAADEELLGTALAGVTDAKTYLAELVDKLQREGRKDAARRVQSLIEKQELPRPKR